jgi:Legume lectin domain
MHAKTLLISGLITAATALGARTASAQSFNYCDFASVAGLTLNGSASQNITLLQLTPNTANEAGSAYRTVAIPLTATTSFFTSFHFELTPNSTTGADGISFIVENAATGAAAIGTNGGGMGYGLNNSGAGPGGGIAKSVEVEFDTFQNTWDPNANHVAVMSNGNNQTHLATYTPPFTMAGSGIIYAWVDYNGATTTLTVYVSQSFTKPAAPNITEVINVFTTLGAQAFVGFTGSTGGETNTQEILEWQFSTTGEPCACGGNSACGGSTPICDATSQTCRACSSNADCTAPTPVCAPTGNPKAGQCVVCASDTNCDSNPNTNTPICSLTGATTDTCVACTTSAQCAAGAPGLEPLCDTSAPYTGQCVECLTSTDCATVTLDPNCVSTGVTNVCGCLTNTNCTIAAPICDVTTNQCEGCTSDSQCSVPTPACQTSGTLMGECTQCSSTNVTQCTGATPACDDTTGTCVGCTSNANCSGTTPICNLTTNTCAPCASNTDCASMTTTPYCATSGAEMGACVACLANIDCASPTPICNPANDICVGCLMNTDCSGTSPICNMTTNTCMPCSNNAECTAPTPACQMSGTLAGECTQCSSTNTVECMTGSDTPVCVASSGECGCTMNSDCASDQTCSPSMLPAGKCVMKPDAGVDASKDGPSDAPPDQTIPSDGAPDAARDGGHFVDAMVEGGVADNGSIGGGGCACSSAGRPARSEVPWTAAVATLLALAACAERRRRHETSRSMKRPRSSHR